MDKLTAIKIKNPDGSYSTPIAISALAQNVLYGDGVYSVKDILDSLDARIDNITAVGSDAQLTAIRIGADYDQNDSSTHYASAATAVRANDIKNRELVLVKDTQPTETWNKLWFDTSDTDEQRIISTDDMANIIAAYYDEEADYAIGDYVIYEDTTTGVGKLYKCKTAISGGETWTAAHWNEISITEDYNEAIQSVNNQIDDLKSDLSYFGEEGYLPVNVSPSWQNGYVGNSGKIFDSSQSAFALISLNEGQTLTVGTRNSNIAVLSYTSANSVSVGDTVTPIYKTTIDNTYQEFEYTAETSINVVVCVTKTEYNLEIKESSYLKEKISFLEDKITYIENNTNPIEKTLTWSDGWINGSTGKIVASTASQFALTHIKRGESVKVGTKNTTTCFIGSTSQNSVSVGDTINVIKSSDSTNSFITHVFRAEYDINAVICVSKSAYNVEFYKENETLEQTKKIPDLNSAFFNGYYLVDVVENGSFNSYGVTFFRENRIRTNVVYFTKGTRIVIENGSFQHGCAIWEGSVAFSNKRRNDGSFISESETYVAPYDGCIIVVFRDPNNGNISPSDFDGLITVYPCSYDNISDTLHKLDGARHISRNAATPLTILHMSDIHADKIPYNRIISQANFFADKIDDIICTGDMVADTYTEISSWWDERVMTCIGNHDTASRNGNNPYVWTALSMADRDAYYIAPFESAWGVVHTSGTSYYYKDYNDSNVRLIVMDGMLYNDNGSEATTQTAWLSNLLSDSITNGLHVLIAIHAPHDGSTPIDCSFTSLGTNTMPAYPDCNTPQSVINTVGTAIQNGLHFIGYICGHTHLDAMWDAENDKTQLMYCVTCALSTYNVDLNRGANFDAYNLITIDTAHTLIKIIRGGGADIDVNMRSREAICFDYSTGQILGEIF